MRRPTASGQAFGFRQVTISDNRGKILVFADRLAVGSSAIGLSGVTFAPAVLERLRTGRIARVIVASGGRLRVELRHLHLLHQSGERRLPEGGWIADAAVGTYRSIRRLTSRRRQ